MIRQRRRLAEELQGAVEIGGVHGDDSHCLLRPEMCCRIGGLDVNASPRQFLNGLGQCAGAVLDLREQHLVDRTPIARLAQRLLGLRLIDDEQPHHALLTPLVC